MSINENIILSNEENNSSHRIGTIEDAEDFQRHNRFILTGYRINFRSTMLSLKSIVMLHNETLNIWTHLLGSLFYFVIIVIFICSYKFRNYIINFNKEIYDDVNYVFSVENKLSKFPIFVFLVSSLCCLGLSATYHTFTSMNKERDRFLQKFDFAGISILIFGSCLPIFYASFYCNWVMFYIYTSIIFTACVAAFFIFFIDKLHTNKYKLLKGGIYLIITLLIFIPFFDIIIRLYGANNHHMIRFTKGYNLVLLQGCIYIIGMFIYIAHFPERFKPKTFDIWFNSHVIWHILIFIASIIQFKAILNLYIQRSITACN